MIIINDKHVYKTGSFSVIVIMTHSTDQGMECINSDMCS